MTHLNLPRGAIPLVSRTLKPLAFRFELTNKGVDQNRVSFMRITLALDTLAVGVAVCVVVSSTSASGVRQAATAIASDTSIDHARILQTTDSADEASEEARMPLFPDIFSAFRPALEVNQLPEKAPLLESQSSDVLIKDVPIKGVLDKGASTEDAFSTLGLGDVSPLTGGLTDVLKKIREKEEDYDHFKDELEKLTPDPPNNMLPGHYEAKSQDTHKKTQVENSIETRIEAFLLGMSTLDKELQAVVKYLGKYDFKTWLDHALTKSGGGSPKVVAYQTFRDAFGVLEAAAIIELSLWHEPGYAKNMMTRWIIGWTPEMRKKSEKARGIGEILQEGQFDDWYNLKIKSVQGVLKHLYPSEEDDSKVPFVLISRIVRAYEEHFNGKNSGEHFKYHGEI